MPFKSVSIVLDIAHDSRIGGHLKFAKSMSRLGNYRWRHKAHDKKRYVDAWRTCQQYKDCNK